MSILIVTPYGDKFYYNNKYEAHREDGPAIMYGDIIDHAPLPKQMWFLNGRQFHCSSQKEFERMIRLKAFW